MTPKLNFITLAVRDVTAARAFYVDGLGWPPAFEVPGEILFVRLSPTLVLSFWRADEFEAEVGGPLVRSGVAPVTLAYNVPTPALVNEVLATAKAAGATLLMPATARDWGGYSGYFTCPNGFAWEVAYNPGPLGVELMEAEKVEGVVGVIRSRRSVPQGLLAGGPELDHEEVVRAVESARWAPNHRRTEPWRFHLLDEPRLKRLAELWGEQLERTGSSPERAAVKRRAWEAAPGVVVVTCTSAADADETTRLEDYAATACAVQNMCLHLWSKGIATKWSTAAVQAHEGFWPLLGYPGAPADTRLVALLFYGLAREAPKAHRRLGVADVLVDFRAASGDGA